MVQFKQGQRVFFRHKVHNWIKGTIEYVEENTKRRRKSHEEFVFSIRPLEPNNPKDRNSLEPLESIVKITSTKKLHPWNEEDLMYDVEDLLETIEIHEATLLQILKHRFFKDQIFTFIGPMIVSINPFKWTIPHYQNDKMIDYIEQKPDVYPHGWKIADRAYREMLETKENHSILVSGESGAGKTEAAKSVISYLSQLSCYLLGKSSSDATDSERYRIASQISERIKESGPILEAFGNAKTGRNDNSSRFGKFIKLLFDKQGVILGANVVNYLLEKSRLTKQGAGERSYHIFYQILAGFSDAERAKYHITKAEDYKCLMGGNCTTVNGVDDKDEYFMTRKAMDILGMTTEEQENILKIVCSILHLQNIEFKDNEDDIAQIVNSEPLNHASELLEMDPDVLLKALTTKTRYIMKKEIISQSNTEQANDSRDALTKAIYSCTFNWIISKINDRLSVDKYDNFIGLLDIFGFETFEVNSFEQFCINYANEALQFHYNDYNFKRDLKECMAEGIDVASIKFRDNTPCIELIQGKKGKNHGILGYLDEQCIFPRATDMTFLQLIKKQYGENHKFFETNRLKHSQFYVKHFAGTVEYDVSDWLIKNKDELKKGLILALQSSNNSFIQTLVEEPKKVNGRFPTVGGSFKQQLTSLLTVINSTNPHWIRCIKSHPSKKPDLIHGEEVMNQLKSSGVLETIHIRREGFCYRIPHDVFVGKYRIIANINNPHDVKRSSIEILESLNFPKDQAQVGKTKVFLRIEPYRILNEKRNSLLAQYILSIQKHVRMKLAEREVARIHEERERERMRLEMEKCREEIERLEFMKKERHDIAESLNATITRDNQFIQILKEKSSQRTKMIEVHRLRQEVEEKERRLEEKRRQEALLKQAEARKVELEKLRRERLLYEQLKREREIAEFMEEERLRKLEEEREREALKLEYQMEQQRKILQKRQERIQEHFDKISRQQMQRDEILRRQNQSFQKARESLYSEQKTKQKRERKSKRLSKSKTQFIEDIKTQFAILEEQRLRNILRDKDEALDNRREKEKMRQARVEYIKKLQYRQNESRYRDIKRKEERTKILLDDLQKKRETRLAQQASERQSRLEKIQKRQEEIDQIILENQEHMDLKRELEKISKKVRKKVMKERNEHQTRREIEHSLELERSLTSSEFHKVLEKKRYEEEMVQHREIYEPGSWLSPKGMKSPRFKSPKQRTPSRGFTSPKRTYISLKSPRSTTSSCSSGKKSSNGFQSPSRMNISELKKRGSFSNILNVYRS